MKRFAKVVGVAGKLVLDPRVPDANPRRFVGMQRKADLPAKWQAFAELYEPCEAVVEKATVADAIKSGDLICLGECVAASAGEATFASAAKAAPKKGSDS